MTVARTKNAKARETHKNGRGPIQLSRQDQRTRRRHPAIACPPGAELVQGVISSLRSDENLILRDAQREEQLLARLIRKKAREQGLARSQRHEDFS